jgi:trimethylamine--corrinoid protein Co-methyltransferase
MEFNSESFCVPQYRLLSENHLKRIHSASLEILERTGVNVLDEEGRNLLLEAGALVVNDNIVKIPSYIVEKALRSVAKRIAISNRNGERKLLLEGKNFYFGTGSDDPYVLDASSGKIRRALKRDTERTTLISDYLPNIDFVMSMANVSDVPPETVYLHQFEAMLLNTQKPIIFTAKSEEDLAEMIDMAAVVSGSLENLQHDPFIIHYAEPISPLTHPDDSIRKLMLCAENRIPLVYVPAISAGGTGPVTMAGSIALANAEILSGLVMHQLKAPGSPFISGGTITIMDMAAANYIHGTPEHYLATNAIAELAQYYGIPVFGSGARSDAKVVDAQAGIEGALSAFNAALCGTSLIHNVGCLSTCTVASDEALVIADEYIGLIKRFFNGLSLNKDSLALDLIDKVGPGKQFLTEDHTLENFRKEFWFPELLEKGNLFEWQDKGEPTINIKALEKINRIISNHEPVPLPDAVLKEVSAIMQRSCKKYV